MATMAADPKTQEWWAIMEPMQQPLETRRPGEWWAAISTGNGNDSRGQVPSLPASLLTRIRAVPQVGQASGAIGDQAQLVGHDGKVISRGGAPGRPAGAARRAVPRSP